MPLPTPKMMDMPIEPPEKVANMPLFIKIDKYNDLVENVHKLKSFALSMRDVLDALAEMQNQIGKGLEVAHKTLDRFNQTISLTDARLMRSQVGDTDIRNSEKNINADSPEDIEKYVRELHDQIRRIKTDLERSK